MYDKRYKFWSENVEKLKLINDNIKSYDYFEKMFFTDSEKFKKFFNLVRDKFNFSKNIESCYKIFVCDLVNKNLDEDVWGDAIQYCKSKPTPEQEVLTTQIKFIDDNVDNGSFNGGDVTTYNNGMKVYDKIVEDEVTGLKKAYRFFPPIGGKLKCYEFKDETFTDPYYIYEYTLSGLMPESINESIKRWLDIMNKTSRVAIKEQTILKNTKTPTKNNPEYTKKQEEIKTNADKDSSFASLTREHFPTMPWGDKTAMTQKTKEVKDLIGRGWRGLEFTYFLQGLEIKGYTDLYNSIKPNNELAMTNPTDAEKLSGDYEEKTIDGFKKPVYNKRGSSSIQSTDSQNFNETTCAQVLADFYKGCGGRTNRSQATDISLRDDYDTYIQSKEFLQKKKFILACDSQGFYTQRFKNTGDLKDMTKQLMSRSSEATHPGKDKSGASACRIIFTTNR